MHIENEVKYDFSDVLIKPKRSYYTSRKEVDLERTFKFKWSDLVWKGIPVVASNMDTVGTIGSAKVLSKHNTLTCLHKFHTAEELLKIPKGIKKNVAITIGVAEGLQILYEIGKDYGDHTRDITPGQSNQDFNKMVGVMQKKNMSMREALAKVWGMDEGKNPFKKEDKHKTMTGKPTTKIEVDPDIEDKE